MALPDDSGNRARRVAWRVAERGQRGSIVPAPAASAAAGATVFRIGPLLGPVRRVHGEPYDSNRTLENAAAAHADGLVLQNGVGGLKAPGGRVEGMVILSNPCRHGRSIPATGTLEALLDRPGVSAKAANGEPGPCAVPTTASRLDDAMAGLMAALGRHRDPERQAGMPAP